MCNFYIFYLSFTNENITFARNYPSLGLVSPLGVEAPVI
jgi:hypothetical protein